MDYRADRNAVIVVIILHHSKAEEMTDKRRFSNALLRIDVDAGHSGNAPRLLADSLEGFVEENSPVGTLVTSMRRKGQPLEIRVVDQEPVSDCSLKALCLSNLLVNYCNLLYWFSVGLPRRPFSLQHRADVPSFPGQCWWFLGSCSRQPRSRSAKSVHVNLPGKIHIIPIVLCVHRMR